MTAAPANFAERAEILTSRNIPVVPVMPGEKGCKLPNWPALATTDPARIQTWNQTADFNTGAVCLPDGICVLDADSPELLSRLPQPLPETFTVRSGGKGLPHLYFLQTDESRALGNRKVEGLCDFQQDRKYVVGPGSVLAGGGTYEIAKDAPLAPIPSQLCTWIRENSTAVKRPISQSITAERTEHDGWPVSRGFDFSAFCDHYGITGDWNGNWFRLTSPCPMSEHTQNATTTSIYFDGEYLGFKCFDTDCPGEHATIGQVIRHLNKTHDAYPGEIWPDSGSAVKIDPNLSLSDALAQFNDEYCFVNENHAIVQMSNRMVMSAADFRGAHAANKFATQDDGTTRKKVPIAKAWLEWPGRRQVESMVYEPGKPEFFDNQLNRWRGWGCEPKPGDTTPWEKLLDSLFRGDKAAQKWFEQWCAYPIQHPGAKLAHAVILWGAVQGTGKTTIGETLGRIYGDNFSVIREEQLHAPFNDWAADKQFILADEITGTGDKRTHADRLKLMVTGSTIHVNKKFEPQYTLRDSINYLFTSNHCNSFYVEDSDRRFFVWEVNGPALSGEFFTEYYRWLDNGGASALFHRLQRIDLSDFQPHQAPPKTAAKQEMIELGWSELDRWIHQLIADPTKLIEKGGHVWTCSELLAQYELATGSWDRGGNRVKQTGMAAGLKRAGLRSQRVQVRGLVDAYCFAFGPGWNERPKSDWVVEYVKRHA
jgi:hypothetical protein